MFPASKSTWVTGSACAVLVSFHLTSFAQGSLTPPGPPGPSMKALDQLEPRTPIVSVPCTLSNSGSYFLTANLAVTSGDAITIATNGVTVDLNGFTLSSSNPSETGSGIVLGSGVGDITIRNGHIRGGVTNNGSGIYSGPGFGFGIYFPALQPFNVLVSHVSVSGCASGIFLSQGYSTVVESCTVQTVHSYGIYAMTVKDSAATDCGGTAIYASLVCDSIGQCSGSGDGISAATVQNSHGYSQGAGRGVFAGADAHNCDGSSLSGYGVYAAQTAIGCNGYSTSGTGLFAVTAAYCVGSRTGGTAIQATVANGCYAASGTNNITYKYNMP